MAIFSKDSLETLRQRIDLIEVVSSHIELKRMGASYKALCPFHDEKSPSFMIQKGDSHYHCFGCGAHGDAIQFLMAHVKMNFADAVESLAQRFHVHLEHVEGIEEQKGPSKAAMKEALDHASRFYHFMLLYTSEGNEVLRYLYSRGLGLDFVKQFQIGLAPKISGMLRNILHGKFVKDEVLAAAGLITPGREGGWRDFFLDRITFPIRDVSGSVIGFSARKYKEETFGGKYINTSETPLFKKSRVLFGLNYCRRRIAKEKKAIIVEGQIDALRLIQAGFNITVAGQGTAFGEGHARELLNLGLNEVFLALDGDLAGIEATKKIGELFQKEGVEVRIVNMPHGHDPDSILRQYGTGEFMKLLEKSQDYLTFLVKYYSQSLDAGSPAGKNQLVQTIAKQIRGWEHPVMVHESLRKLAHLAQVSEDMVTNYQEHTPNLYIKKSASIGIQTINPDLILESDFLRWLLLMGESLPHFVDIAKKNLKNEDFHIEACRSIYTAYLSCCEKKQTRDFLSLAIEIEHPEGQQILNDLMNKIVNKERADQHYVETIQKMLDRNWMELREGIKMKIQSGQYSDEDALLLVQQFDGLKRNPPKVVVEPLNSNSAGEGCDRSQNSLDEYCSE